MKRRLAKLLTILLTVSAISGAEVVSAAAAAPAPERVMAAETDMPDAAAVAETVEEPAEDPVPGNSRKRKRKSRRVKPLPKA